MSNHHTDTAVTRLRPLVAVIEQEIAQVPTEALRAAWTCGAALEPIPGISCEVSR